MRTALDLRGDLRRLHESLDASFAVLMEEARAEGYQQGLADANAALMQGAPAFQLLMHLKMPPRPPGQEVERA